MSIGFLLKSFYHLTKESVQPNTASHHLVHQNVDFADAYNAVWLLDQGMSVAYTFDRKHISRLAGVTVRVPGTDETDE